MRHQWKSFVMSPMSIQPSRLITHNFNHPILFHRLTVWAINGWKIAMNAMFILFIKWLFLFMLILFHVIFCSMFHEIT